LIEAKNPNDEMLDGCPEREGRAIANWDKLQDSEAKAAVRFSGKNEIAAHESRIFGKCFRRHF
jgi:hypothetical protein